MKKRVVCACMPLFFCARVEHKKNNEQTEALSYVCSLFCFLKTSQSNQSFNA